MNEINRKIIRRLIHEPGLTFNQLWDRDIESNKFAYHLKSLVDEMLIEKQADAYYLTSAGKSRSAFIDGETGEESKVPLVAVAIVVEKDGKVLMQQRKKEPFYNYWGFPSGKIKFSQFILEAAEEELLQETGLSAELAIKGLKCIKTYAGESQAFSHFLFVVKGTNPRGKQIDETREGINSWVPIDKIKELDIFPDVPKIIESIARDGFTLTDMKRTQTGDKFTGFEAIRETRY
jgi:8-oxo-dGTP pyrophosphatase MutT (NUDIX family)